jgi:hypothetical protein
MKIPVERCPIVRLARVFRFLRWGAKHEKSIAPVVLVVGRDTIREGFCPAAWWNALDFMEKPNPAFALAMNAHPAARDETGLTQIKYKIRVY